MIIRPKGVFLKDIKERIVYYEKSLVQVQRTTFMEHGKNMKLVEQ